MGLVVPFDRLINDFEFGCNACNATRKASARILLGAGLSLYGPDPTAGHARAALVAFNHETVHSSDLATFLDMEGELTSPTTSRNLSPSRRTSPAEAPSGPRG